MPAARNWFFCAALVAASCSFAIAQSNETVLYSFGTNGGTSDGWGPIGQLTIDSAGNIYGATASGGSPGAHCPDGCGTIFELSPAAGGAWTETLIHVFTDGQDGDQPEGGLTFDGNGNLFGTTHGSGDNGCLPPDCGTVFELSPSLDGSWTETILYSFGALPDGEFPAGPVTLDLAGNVYGTTVVGGTTDGGIVFELSLSSGNWTETELYSFCVKGVNECYDGENPFGAVVLGGPGNLYGATANGGTGGGVVYELSPGANGGWEQSVLFRFNQSTGGIPEGGVTLDVAGNLYGTLDSGGLSWSGCQKESFPPYKTACGGVFRLARKGNRWIESSFLFSGKNGGNPMGALVISGDSAFGATYLGGLGNGTVFKITGQEETVIYDDFSGTNGVLPGYVTINQGLIYGTALGGPFDQGVVFSVTP
jgi:hypothetical protein